MRYERAGDRELFDLVKALFVAALTFYAKAYTTAAGRGTQMSRDWLDNEYRESHDYYMTFRHNFAAHSGDEQLELAKSYIVLTPGSLVPAQIATTRIQPDAVLSEESGDKFCALIRHAIGKVHDKYNELGVRITLDIILPKGQAFWVDAAARGEVATLKFPPKTS